MESIKIFVKKRKLGVRFLNVKNRKEIEKVCKKNIFVVSMKFMMCAICKSFFYEFFKIWWKRKILFNNFYDIFVEGQPKDISAQGFLECIIFLVRILCKLRNLFSWNLHNCVMAWEFNDFRDEKYWKVILKSFKNVGKVI